MRLTVLSLFLLALTLESLPRATTQGAVESGRIEGVAFRQGTIDPISEVVVTLVASSGTVANTSQAPAQRTAFTGRDGRFAFENVQPGDYTVRAQLDGYFSADDTGGGAPVTVSTVRTAVAAGETRQLRFPMIQGGAIGGRLQTSNGRPAIGVQVVAYRLGYRPDGAPVLQSVGNRASDDHGEFRVYHLPPGTYYLSATPNNSAASVVAAARGGATVAVPVEGPVRTYYPNALDVADARAVTLASGEEIEGNNIDIRNAVFAKVSGKVTSALPRSAYDPPPSTAARGTNAAAAQADPAAVQAALAALDQIRAQRGQPGAAGGTAVTPLPTVQLQLFQRDRRALQEPIRQASAAMAAPNDGVFNLQNVPPGSYVLYASLPDNSGGVAGRAYGRASVDVGTADVSDIAITVRHGVDVTGRVYTDGDRSALAGMRIILALDDSAATFGNREGEVREDGAFTVPTYGEAAYRLQARFGSSPAAHRAFLAGVRQGDVDVFDSGFMVGDGPIAPIEILVSVESGSVAGAVRDADGRPVPKAVVTLVPPPARRLNPSLYRTATADTEGKFTMTGVPPGEFKLFAWRSIPSGADHNAAFLARYENSGMPVTIEAGGELHADPALATVGSGVQ